jgi:gamma-glutamylcyclotransferase
VTLYFAYGSNLGESELRKRSPHARQVGIAYAESHRLGFTRRSIHRGGGVADLVPASGRRVWGALFDLCGDSFELLDAYEGAPTAYAREIWTFTEPHGARVSASVYVVIEKQLEAPPSYRYWRLIVDGAREAGLPRDYIAELEGLRHLPR